MQLPSRSDLFNIGADEVLARSEVRPPGQRISREAIFTEGTDINIVLAGASAMADEVMRQLAAECAMRFMDSAEGADLDRRVYDEFGDDVVRKPSAAAVVPLTFARPNPDGGLVTLPIGYRLRTQRGTEFTLAQVLTIAAGSTAPVTVSATAAQRGIGGNVAAGTITRFVQQPPDAALTVTNVEPSTGGADLESDRAFRARARAFFRSARRGILAAIQFGAESVPGVASANAIEQLDDNGDPTGVVFVYIADANGQGNSLLCSAVRSALLEYRGAGVIADVLGATPRYEDITYRLRFEPGTDTAAAFEEVRFLTVAEVNAIKPGATLDRSLLMSIPRRVPGVIVREDAVAEPVGDVVPVGSEVIRTSAELVTLI